MPLSAEDESKLLDVFCSFCGADAEKGQMDGRQFAKMTRDCKMLDDSFTSIDTDIIFAKCKAKAMRKIDFHQFLDAINMCAATKRVSPSALAAKMVKAGGPKIGGTHAGKVRLHDDKAGYTGVAANGGPVTVDTGRAPSMGKPSTPREHAHHVANVTATLHATHVVEGEYTLQTFFKDHSGGAKEMDGRQFAKMARDTKLIDKKFTSIDLDIIFAKVKAKASRKITFKQFKDAITLCAEKKGKSFEELEDYLLKSGGPVFTGVKTDKVKLHDDKSTYTGVYTHGGPDTKSLIAHHDITNLTDRTQADVRGVKRH